MPTPKNVVPLSNSRCYSAEEFPIETRLIDTIRATIEQRGLDISTAAALTGIGRSTLAEYMARRNHIRIDVLAHIVTAFDLRLHAVIRRDEGDMDILEEVAPLIPGPKLRALLVAATRLTKGQLDELIAFAKAPGRAKSTTPEVGELLSEVAKMDGKQIANLLSVAKMLNGRA